MPTLNSFLNVYKEHKTAGNLNATQASRELWMQVDEYEKAVDIYEHGKVQDLIEYISQYDVPKTTEERKAWAQAHRRLSERKRNLLADQHDMRSMLRATRY